MNQQELERKFRDLYRKADYQTRKKIDRDLHKILSKKKGESMRQNAFFKAVKDGNTIAVKNIFKEENYVDVNVQDELGNTALIYAVLDGYTQIVKMLLDEKADPLIENKKGKNSLDTVEFSKRKNEMRNLISKYNKSKVSGKP